MKKNLEQEAYQLFPHLEEYSEWTRKSFAEYVQDDYDDITKYGNDDHTYIYKIGCLRIVDANKLDFAHLFFGMERRPNEFVFLGHLHFPQGENDDLETTLKRISSFVDHNFVLWG